MLHSDPSATKAIAHKIKGAAANIADTELASIAGQVEKAAEQGLSAPGADVLLATLLEHVQQLSQIAEAAEAPSPADKKSAQSIHLVIARMVQRLSGNRIASDDDIEQVLGFLRENNETDLASSLRRALETYKFNEATGLLSKIESASRNSGESDEH